MKKYIYTLLLVLVKTIAQAQSDPSPSNPTPISLLGFRQIVGLDTQHYAFQKDGWILFAGRNWVNKSFIQVSDSSKYITPYYLTHSDLNKTGDIDVTGNLNLLNANGSQGRIVAASGITSGQNIYAEGTIQTNLSFNVGNTTIKQGDANFHGTLEVDQYLNLIDTFNGGGSNYWSLINNNDNGSHRLSYSYNGAQTIYFTPDENIYDNNDVRFAKLTDLSNYALSATTINPGYGLNGGGSLSNNRIFYVDTTSIISKTYFNSIIGTAVLSKITTKQDALNGTGFIKIFGSTISYDSTKYLTSVGLSNMSIPANSFAVNSTNITATPTAAVFKDIAQQTYSGTPNFTATTAPGGSSNNTYQWTQTGHLVTMRFSFLYTAPGSAVTLIQFPLPVDMPSPAIPDGLDSAGTKLYSGNGGFANDQFSPSQNSTKCTLITNSTNSGFLISVVAESSNASYFYGTISYWAQ